MKNAKKVLALLFLAAALVSAQAPGASGSKSTKKRKQTTAAVKPVSAPQAVTIPKDAIANPNGTYTWTDKQGKKWNYAQSPFGMMRTQISDAPASSDSPLAGVKAFDEGDKIRFERASFFRPDKMGKKQSRSDR